METTPSLACANKCVFCWRHHTNPVGTEWKWQQDPPDLIIKGAIQNHYDMIKQFKGTAYILHYLLCRLGQLDNSTITKVSSASLRTANPG